MLDDLDVARGIIVAVALSSLVWIPLVLWWVV